MPRQPIKQERAHETRARIIAGSASAFAEYGYSGATVADILQRSKVTKGALYFHFDTKEEVAEAVLQAHSAWLGEALASVRGRGLESFVALIDLFCDALVNDNIIRAAARLSVDRATFGLATEPAFRQWERHGAEVLHEAQAQGVLADPVDAEELAHVTMTMLLGAHLASMAAESGRGGIRAEMQKFWSIVLPHTAASQPRTASELGDDAGATRRGSQEGVVVTA